MKKIIEINAAEGGMDSKLFVVDLAKAYENFAVNFGWKSKRLSVTKNKIQIEFEGKDLKELIKEAGGHRIQRVPPTEKRGRVHTSTITVSVTDSALSINNKYLKRKESDYKIEWFSGTGKGGQHRNRTKNCCRLIHIPTGIKQERQGRQRENNKKDAFQAVNKLLDEMGRKDAFDSLGKERKGQIGSGMRGDKIRTYRFNDDRVLDHKSGKSAKCSKVLKGYFNLLW